MENKNWEKIEEEFDKIFNSKENVCRNIYNKGVKAFFKKQFQNQRQEFEDIVKKVNDRNESNGRYNACREILKELNK